MFYIHKITFLNQTNIHYILLLVIFGLPICKTDMCETYLSICSISDHMTSSKVRVGYNVQSLHTVLDITLHWLVTISFRITSKALPRNS